MPPTILSGSGLANSRSFARNTTVTLKRFIHKTLYSDSVNQLLVSKIEQKLRVMARKDVL
jgi:hypothetical protein